MKLSGQRSRISAERYCSSVPKVLRNPSSFSPRTRDGTVTAISVTF